MKTDKYLVIPTKYLAELEDIENRNLEYILKRIEDIRNKHGKSETSRYIVCKDTEPYAEDVWNLILNNSTCDIDEQMVQAHNELDRIIPIDEQMVQAHNELDRIIPIDEQMVQAHNELDRML